MNISGARLVAGALGGVVGVWALDRVSWRLWDREPPAVRAREQAARPRGEDPAQVLAHRAADAMGVSIAAHESAAATAVHYALGIAPGALYGISRARSSRISLARGALFGAGLFLMQDELANTLLHTAGRPREYPWQAHVRGLLAHVAYGVALEGTLGILDRISEGRSVGEDASLPDDASWLELEETSFSDSETHA